MIYILMPEALSGYIIIVPATGATILNCFFIKYVETPCSATLALISKVVKVLRLLLGFSILMKLEHST